MPFTVVNPDRGQNRYLEAIDTDTTIVYKNVRMRLVIRGVRIFKLRVCAREELNVRVYKGRENTEYRLNLRPLVNLSATLVAFFPSQHIPLLTMCRSYLHNAYLAR